MPYLKKVRYRGKEYKVSSNGKIVLENRCMKGRPSYIQLGVCLRGSYHGINNYIGKRRVVWCYMLVAIAYCKGRKSGLMVHHKDHNKENDHYKNLEWITRSENARLAHEYHKAKRLEKQRKKWQKKNPQKGNIITIQKRPNWSKN